LRRLRQIAATGLSCMLVGLGLSYVLVYYAEVDRSGEIVLRNGTRWLEPIFRYLPTLRTRTGIDISMLSADTQSRYPVQSGSLGGIWTHVSEGNFWPTCRAAPSEPNHARALRGRADEGRVLEDAVMDKNQDLFERAGKELNNTVVAQSKVG
jgi:hypothetical protein